MTDAPSSDPCSSPPGLEMAAQGQASAQSASEFGGFPTALATAAAAAAAFPATSLYVGDLHESVQDAQLFHVFSQFGGGVSVRVCRDISSRKSVGYAYVDYSNLDLCRLGFWCFAVILGWFSEISPCNPAWCVLSLSLPLSLPCLGDYWVSGAQVFLGPVAGDKHHQVKKLIKEKMDDARISGYIDMEKELQEKFLREDKKLSNSKDFLRRSETQRKI